MSFLKKIFNSKEITFPKRGEIWVFTDEHKKNLSVTYPLINDGKILIEEFNHKEGFVSFRYLDSIEFVNVLRLRIFLLTFKKHTDT